MAIVGVASIRIKPDLTEFRKELNAELKSIKTELTIKVKVDTKLAQADIDAFVKKESGKTINQRVKVDMGDLKKVQAGLEGVAAAGAKVGVAALAFTAIQTVAQAIVPLLIASSGALLLFPGAIAAAGIGLATVKLGADGIKKAFDALTPTLNKLKAAVSSTFQSGLAPAVQNLKTLIPQLTPGFKAVAQAISAVAVNFTSMLKSNANVAILQGLLKSTAVIIQNVGAALAPVVQAFLTIAGVAAGTLKQLTSGFGTAATKFAQFITASANSGQLFDWIIGGLSALKQLGQIVVQVGGIIAAVFSGLSTGAGNLGGTLLPTLKAINTALSSGAGAAALQALGTAMSQLGQAIGKDLLGVLQALLPLITSVLTFIGNNAQLVIGLVTGIYLLAKAIAVAAAASEAWAVIAGVLDIALDSNPIGAIVLAVEALIAVVALIIIYWGPISGFFTKIGKAIADAFHAAIDWVVGAFHTTVSAITSFFGSIGSFFSGIGDKIASAFQAVVGFFAGLPAKIGSFLASLPSVIGNALLTALKFAATVVVQGLEWIIASFVALPLIIMRTLITFVTTLVTWAQTTGAQVVLAIGTWINSVIAFFIALPGNIISAVSNFGSMIGTWFSNAATNVIGQVVNFVASALTFFQGLPGRIISAVASFGSMIASWAGNALGNLIRSLPGLASGIWGFFQSIPGRILSALGDLGNLLLQAGKAIINGLLNGIKAAISGVFSFVGGIADKIKSLKGPLPYDRKLLIPAGTAIMAGLHQGLSDGFKPVQDLVGGMADTLAGSFNTPIGASVAGQFSSAITASGALDFTPTPVVVNVAANPDGIKDFINVQIDDNSRQIVRGAKAGIGGTTT